MTSRHAHGLVQPDVVGECYCALVFLQVHIQQQPLDVGEIPSSSLTQLKDLLSTNPIITTNRPR